MSSPIVMKICRNFKEGLHSIVDITDFSKRELPLEVFK